VNFACVEYGKDEGVGNNLFNYSWARIHSENMGFKLKHSGISDLNILPTNEDKECSINLTKSQNFLQDFNLYKNHIEQIKSWDIWNPITDVNSKDLVIHLRAGNRFVARNAKYSPTANDFEKIFKDIDFDRLHIVTNMKKTTKWNLDDIKELKKKLKLKGGDGVTAEMYQRKDYPFLTDEEALDYTNSQIECFNNYDPIWINGNVYDDFNYLRSFKKILFPRSTLSWWAAITGVANEVYVYGPWAPHKKMTSGWLGNTDYKGWTSWGK
jgi:hypothetical protein|tara:strand:+ start:484 stop:1287 length:804 start_codon:yes stop_codon:yes gene_type:complete